MVGVVKHVNVFTVVQTKHLKKHTFREEVNKKKVGPINIQHFNLPFVTFITNFVFDKNVMVYTLQ